MPCELKTYTYRFTEELIDIELAEVVVHSFDEHHAKEGALNLFLSDSKTEVWAVNIDTIDQDLVSVTPHDASPERFTTPSMKARQ